METKNLVSAALVALVVSGLFSLVMSFSSAPVTSTGVETEDVGALSLPVHNTPEMFSSGLGFGKDFLTFSVHIVIGAGQNQGAWTNKTGRTVSVELADAEFASGTASSSMRLSVGTSTATSYTNNFAAPYGSLIDNLLIATSTQMTYTIPDSIKDAGTNGAGVIEVQAGESVIFQLRQDRTGTCNGATCEQATSTNRGFGAFDGYLRLHYKP